MSRRKRGKKKKDEQGPDESWLLPYADLLTLLLALFIVLFAMSEVDVKKFKQLAHIFETEFADGGGIFDESSSVVPDDIPVEEDEDENEDQDEGKEEAEDKDTENAKAMEEYQQLKMMQEAMETYIDENSLADTLGTALTSEGLFVTVRTDITFDSGSATVKSEGEEIAAEIAEMLDTDPPHEIVVNGHADDRPVNNDEYASNWELSSMRAIQFMYLLMDDSSIGPKWFSARGYGEHQPIVENTSEHNRATNRRVEVLIQPNYDIEDEVGLDSEEDNAETGEEESQ